MKIPDEAMKAAAKAFIEHGTLSDTLTAAAPHIAAQTLREASDAYPLETAYGGAEHAVIWLNERADHIEAPANAGAFVLPEGEL